MQETIIFNKVDAKRFLIIITQYFLQLCYHLHFCNFYVVKFKKELILYLVGTE